MARLKKLARAVFPRRVVRGDSLAGWADALRASLKNQSASDFQDFEGFVELAPGRFGRWISSMALAPTKKRIVGCMGKFCGYLPELLLNIPVTG